MGSNLESKALKISFLFSLIFACVGVLAALIFESSFLLFVGIYSIIGFLLGIISWQMNIFTQENRARFPLDRTSVETVTVFAQYVVILSYFIYFFIIVVQSFINGPRKIELGIIAIYLVFQTVVLVVAFLKLDKFNRQVSSPILSAISLHWKVSAIMGISAAVFYTIAFSSFFTGRGFLAYYMEPVALGVAILGLLSVYYQDIVNAGKSLIAMEDDEALIEARQINEIVTGVGKGIAAYQTYCQVFTSGHQLIIEIDFIVDEDKMFDSIMEQDMIREKVLRELAYLRVHKCLKVSFTQSEDWST